MSCARTSSLLVALLLGTALVAAAPAHAQGGLPDVDVVAVLEIRDLPSWLALYDEVLGTPREAPKPLVISVSAGTGGRRSIAVTKPTFMTEINLVSGGRTLKVIVAGKILGTEALAGLTYFQHAVLEAQAGAVDNQALLTYGLSGVTASLLELHLSRP